MEHLERVSRTVVAEGSIIKFCKDHIKLPNGNEADWDFCEHKKGGAAAVLPIDADGNVILVRQFRASVDRYTLEIPAGGREEGDTFFECAYRELIEETGYRCEELKHLVDIYSAVGFCDEMVSIYLAENLIEDQMHLDEDEFIEIERFALDEVVKMIFNGTIKDSKTVSAIMAYKALR